MNIRPTLPEAFVALQHPPIDHADGASVATSAQILGAHSPTASLRQGAVRINGRTLWSDLSFDVRPGELIAILGPNGVGKSTLLKVLLGLLPLDDGEARVLGQPVGHANGRIGYVPQRRSFDSSVRVRGVDMVQLGLDGMRWGFPLPGAAHFSAHAREEAARLRDKIALVGASRYAERPIGELSGGEQQRLLIAQALVRDPALLLLDEPLESLDLPSQAAVSALIERIAHDLSVTVMMVTHDVNPILSYVDRVLYLAGGRALIGPPTEVISTEQLSRLYDSQVEVIRASDGRLVVVGQPGATAVGV